MQKQMHKKYQFPVAASYDKIEEKWPAKQYPEKETISKKFIRLKDDTLTSCKNKQLMQF